MNKTLFTILGATSLFLLSSGTSHASLTQESVASSLNKAEKYYEGLYIDLGENGAVMNEYYSTPLHSYTVRHGVIGGYFYYSAMGDKTKVDKLKKFATAYGFTPEKDIHSYIWTAKNKQPDNEVYSLDAYHDCSVLLPTYPKEVAYHSKVCKLGRVGVSLYTKITKTDTLLPTINQLARLESGKPTDKKVVTDLEKKFDRLGYGMPICTFDSCGHTGSAIRTAEYGELQLRLNNMKEAEKAADALIKAQDKTGAVAFSFDKNGHLKDDKSFIYALIMKILSDNPIFKGYVPTNAETMNDVIAFLLHFQCQKYHVCTAHI